MTIPPIDPTALLGAGGAAWQVPGIGNLSGADLATAGVAPAAAAAGGQGFGGMLAQAVGNLAQTQDTAALASQSLADGTASDPSTVVMAVEKAQLAMQLAGQIRTKGAEAVMDIFHTQI